MKALKFIWDIFQNQILGMKWLNDAIGSGLSALGLDIGNRWVASAQFFIYDVIKITLLLCSLIFIISYIQSFFPPERTKKILGRFHGIGANAVAALL
ncbi:MAG: permease, partial [Clostridiaceae bacterium]|nr:permease [Clostridiaceae bacterium]